MVSVVPTVLLCMLPGLAPCPQPETVQVMVLVILGTDQNNKVTDKLRDIAPDWQARVANYNAFMSDELKKFIEQADIKLIGYRQIRDAMRA